MGFLILLVCAYSLGPLIFLFYGANLIKNKILISVFVLFLVVFQVVNLFLLLYFLDRRFSFDIYLLLYNADVAIKTIYIIYPDLNTKLALALPLLILYYFSLIETSAFIKAKIPIFRKFNKKIFFLITLYILLFSFAATKTEAFSVLSDVINHKGEEARKMYYKYFNYQMRQLGESTIPEGAKNSGRSIIVVQLESLNGSLVSNKITPNFLKIADEGVYLKTMQSNSVNSIRSLEGALCGLIPSLSLDVSRMNPETARLNCLPKILAQTGYKTFFFMSDDVLNDTRPFVSKLGFDEVHFEDIMRAGDPRLRWGYKDDIFLQRVFEYLKKYKDEKIFAFVDLSTNHFPFFDLSRIEIPEYNNIVPYPNPLSFKEKLENTSYIQDIFLGEFYEKIYKNNYAESTDLIIFSDHSWPYGIHPNNIFNENFAYQENLTIPFIFVPAKLVSYRFALGSQYDNIFSQYDIPSTVLNLLDIPDNFHKTSFLPLLLKDARVTIDKKCAISTQPYSGGYISLVRYPEKYIYSLKENIVLFYNLDSDKNETDPKIEEISQQNIEILSECLKDEVS